MRVLRARVHVYAGASARVGIGLQDTHRVPRIPLINFLMSWSRQDSSMLCRMRTTSSFKACPFSKWKSRISVAARGKGPEVNREDIEIGSQIEVYVKPNKKLEEINR